MDLKVEKIRKLIFLNFKDGFDADDENLTKSIHLGVLQQLYTKYMNYDFYNLTIEIIDQKDTNLCVPITITSLIRHAIKKDLQIDDAPGFTFENILNVLVMIVYPRSLAGLNLNPAESEKAYQLGDVFTFLKRLTCRTFLSENGWFIIRKIALHNVISKSDLEFKSS